MNKRPVLSLQPLKVAAGKKSEAGGLPQPYTLDQDAEMMLGL
jgi:hypothetical protein